MKYFVENYELNNYCKSNAKDYEFNNYSEAESAAKASNGIVFQRSNTIAGFPRDFPKNHYTCVKSFGNRQTGAQSRVVK